MPRACPAYAALISSATRTDFHLWRCTGSDLRGAGALLWMPRQSKDGLDQKRTPRRVSENPICGCQPARTRFNRIALTARRGAAAR
jgi:hypothetical protein